MSNVIKLFVFHQYTICRTLIGTFLIYVFVSCWLAREALIATQFAFPGSFFESFFQIPFFSSSTFLQAAILLGIAASFFFAIGFFTRLSAFSAWIALVLVFNFNFAVGQFHYHYISFSLWIYVLFSNESWLTLKSDGPLRRFSSIAWKIPLASLFYFTITLSGFSKALVDHWWTGESLKYLCKMSVIPAYCQLPMFGFQFLSTSVLIVEIMAILYIPFKKFRLLIWISQTALYSGISIFMFHPVFHIALAFIILELFLFDERDLPHWLKAKWNML